MKQLLTIKQLSKISRLHRNGFHLQLVKKRKQKWVLTLRTVLQHLKGWKKVWKKEKTCLLFYLRRRPEHLCRPTEWEKVPERLCFVESLQARRAVVGFPVGEGEGLSNENMSSDLT